MGVYMVTGAASGMGRATAEHLRWQGHQVISVDLRDADVIADLSTQEGRAHAVQAVLQQCKNRLDGAVLAAGLGGIPGRERLIAEVNYLGVVELLEGLHPALAAAGNSKVVIFGSNSTTTTPAIPAGIVDAFARRDLDAVLDLAKPFGDKGAHYIYACSKIAVTHWMRTVGVTKQWAGSGIRMNAIAPGAIMTPMLEKSLANPEQAASVKAFPIPVGGFGKPEDVAQWVYVMLSPAANFLCGSVIYLDGGTDAYFRPNDWPAPLSADRTAEYMEKITQFAAQR